MFFGRDMELRELTTAGKRRAVLVIGPRKVGKSSLLRRAEALLRERNERAVYVVLRETVATPGQLAEQLSRRAGAGAPALPDDWGASARSLAPLCVNTCPVRCSCWTRPTSSWSATARRAVPALRNCEPCAGGNLLPGAGGLRHPLPRCAVAERDRL